MCINFAKKLAQSHRYSDWLPAYVPGRAGLRSEQRYEEFFARTNRLYNSPIYYMRRQLNKLATEEGGLGSSGVDLRGRTAPTRENNNQRCDFLYDEWR